MNKETISVDLDVVDCNIIGRALLFYQLELMKKQDDPEAAGLSFLCMRLAAKILPHAERKANEERLSDMQN